MAAVAMVMIGLGVCLILLGGSMLQKRLSVWRLSGYRQAYLELMRTIDTLTERASVLEKKLSAFGEPARITAFERSVHILETLLTAFKRMNPYKDSLVELRKIAFLTAECARALAAAEQEHKAALAHLAAAKKNDNPRPET